MALTIIFKAKAKLTFASTFNRLKFLSFSLSLSLSLSLSDAPNLDLNNPTVTVIKSTLVQLVYSSKVDTLNIKNIGNSITQGSTKGRKPVQAGPE